MGTNQYQIDPSSGHPADVAMAREAAGSPPASALTPEELATYSKLDPATLVSTLANSDVEVPADSPIRKMSGDQLKEAMRQGMNAIKDFRSVQASLNKLDARVAEAQSNPTNANMRRVMGIPSYDSMGRSIIQDSEFQKAEQAVEQSQRSARQAGLGDYEYNEAVRQLAESAPEARPAPAPATPSGQPYEITKEPDGSYDVLLDTGEHFRGNADQLIEQLAKAKQETGKWGRNLHAQLKQLRNGQTPAAPVPSEPTQSATTEPQFGPDADALARTLGFSGGIEELAGEWQGMQQRLAAANEFASKYKDEQVSDAFIAANPDFPGTREAIDTLGRIMDASDLDYSKPENLSLAHQYAVKRGFYAPLPQDAIQAGIRGRENPSGRHVPPPPPQGNAPGGDENLNPWAMPKDALRKRVLEGGGIGKALMDLKPGETFGI